MIINQTLSRDEKDQFGAALPPPSRAASIPVLNQILQPFNKFFCLITSRHLRTEVDVASYRVGSKQGFRVSVLCTIL